MCHTLAGSGAGPPKCRVPSPPKFLAREAVDEDGDELTDPRLCTQLVEVPSADRRHLAGRDLIGKLPAKAVQYPFDLMVECRLIHVGLPFPIGRTYDRIVPGASLAAIRATA